MAKDRTLHELESYKHSRDTEQDRIRVGDKVVNRYGRTTSPWEVTRIYKLGERGQSRFDLVRPDPGAAGSTNVRIGALAADFQRKGDQS